MEKSEIQQTLEALGNELLLAWHSSTEFVLTHKPEVAVIVSVAIILYLISRFQSRGKEIKSLERKLRVAEARRETAENAQNENLKSLSTVSEKAGLKTAEALHLRKKLEVLRSDYAELERTAEKSLKCFKEQVEISRALREERDDAIGIQEKALLNLLANHGNGLKELLEKALDHESITSQDGMPEVPSDDVAVLERDEDEKSILDSSFHEIFENDEENLSLFEIGEEDDDENER